MLAARLAGISRASIERGLRSFEGLPHRMVRVGEIDGVTYLDDSKATNVGAAAAALDGLDDGRGRVVLIAGGRDKGGSYAPLRERMDGIGRAVVTIGEAAPLVEAAFEGSALVVARASTMDDAVRRCRELAEPGDRVLLAPACSSYDMFRSYSERGDAFRSAVVALGGKP
jgi:UDP-N-acetylmuramoylalanine--D-glutamate ligase